MSKAECLSYLQSHPGQHTLLEIATSTGQNLETARKMMTRLAKDGMVQRDYPKAANKFILWWA